METVSMGTLWALVLAGGDGTRLTGLTRLIAGAPIPKQFCRIWGDRSLLETTLDRIVPLVPRRRTLAIVTRPHLGLALPQLSALPVANVLVQPRNLDTGPGITTSLLALARRARDATVVVFPSDHDVRDDEAFRESVGRLLDVVACHPLRIGLLGVCPQTAGGGYGYIARGRALDGAPGAFHVLAFREKPAPALAARLVRRGALWNTFIMGGRAARILELLRGIRPADIAAGGGTGPWNFSRDFLARIPEHLAVVPAADLGWSDWGTPEAVERTFAQLGVLPPWRSQARAQL